MAESLEVTISSPATSGKDEAAVSGTALPFKLSGPEPVTLPSGSAAIRIAADMMRISRHTYFIATSCYYLPE
jgi:hypothetical protein